MILLAPGLTCILLSILFYNKAKIWQVLLLLVLGNLGLGFFMAQLDPFLNTWDELYHAMVAKNLMTNPFYPVLYKTPILSYDKALWTDNYIWLHKQPLFLWNMALSLKLFGINELAVRIPSVFMHTLISVIIYRIGTISLNQKTGFYAAVLFSIAFYPLELISGKYTADHNDIAFLFYISASFWAWFEYIRSGNRLWLLLIGLFSGFAILVKWLMGFLVYIGWAFTYLTDLKSILKVKRYLDFTISFSFSLLIVLPWQVYILNRFPVESRIEYYGFSNHFSTMIEGHGGDFLFHIDAINILYGRYMIFPVLIAIIFLYINLKHLNQKVFVSGIVIFVYMFFSFAATKMLSFCLIVSPFIFLGIANLYIHFVGFITKLINSGKARIFVEQSLFILLCIYFFNYFQIQKNHDFGLKELSDYRKHKIKERLVIKSLSSYLPNKNYIIFNATASQGGNISVMFYSDYIAYRHIPSIRECNLVLKKGYKIAVLDRGVIPEYIRNDNRIVKVPMVD